MEFRERPRGGFLPLAGFEEQQLHSKLYLQVALSGQYQICTYELHLEVRSTSGV
jgi:hypothetical protein